MPVQKVPGGYRWGKTGKVYKTKAAAEKQGKAIYASGYAEGGLYANIHAKRKRIAAGSGEKMRRPGTKGAPTAEAFKQAAKTKANEGGLMMNKKPMNAGMKALKKEAPAVAKKMGYKSGGMAKKSGYNEGGYAMCGASNPGTQKRGS